MNNQVYFQDPVLVWLKKRSCYVKDTGNWDWVLGDPIVGHLAPALFLLDKKGIAHLSDKNRHEFSQVYWKNIARWLVTENLLKQVLSLFIQAGVPVIPLKGAAFQGLLYKNIGLRYMSDVDLLVPTESFLMAIKILGQCGFRICPKDDYENIIWFAELPIVYWPKELSFSGPHGLVIELHQNLINSWFLQAFPLNMDAIWERAIAVSIDDPLHKKEADSLWRIFLSPYDTLAYLCLHLALHGLMFPQSYLDVDLWIRDLPSDWDWNSFIELINKWQIRSAVYHVLSYSQTLMGTPIPEGILKRLNPGWLARWRVGSLISSQSFLANKKGLASRYPTLVKLAIIDRLPIILVTLIKLAFPEKAWLEQNPVSRNLLERWMHILHVVKRGD
jgi:hypothetical protein